MSRMSQLHAELSEKAYKLGFESLDQAIESGEYEVISDGNWADLVPTKDELDKAYEEKHEAWLKERDGVLADLKELRSGFAEGGYHDEMDALDRAIAFVKEAHD